MNLYTALTLRYLKENKKRTIVTIIGIILQQLWEFLIKHYFCLKNNIRIAIISKKVSKIISKLNRSD